MVYTVYILTPNVQYILYCICMQISASPILAASHHTDVNLSQLPTTLSYFYFPNLIDTWLFVQPKQEYKAKLVR